MTKDTHNFYQDPSGMWHHASKETVMVQDAAQEACEHVAGRPAWFWWNGTFSPILPSDTANKLVDRWSEWRRRYQENPKNILVDLEVFSKSST